MPAPSNHHVLLELPGVVEIERLARGQGGWFTDPEIAARAAPVSAAIFGITARDTRKEVARDLTGSARAAAIREYNAWESHFADLERDRDGDLHPIWYFDELGFDITDDDGIELRCWPFFARQMVVIGRELMQDARVSRDGSAHRVRAAEEAAIEWAAAMERDARTFSSKLR